MKIKYYCPLWGMSEMPLTVALEQIKAWGYDGAEIALDPYLKDVLEVKQQFKDAGLDLIVLHPYGRGATAQEALQNFKAKLEILLKLEPVLLNCHTGKDFYSFEQNLQFIQFAAEQAKAGGITIAHETHRGTFSFAASLMPQYLDACPEMMLTADFSHWCVVAESLLENQQDTIDKVIPHCAHIHARVGYIEGPQVPHPGAPEYSAELNRHTGWWQQIIDHHKLIHTKELTITCEFGPPPYMQRLPFSGEPVASQYEVNLFMKDYLSKNLIL